MMPARPIGPEEEEEFAEDTQAFFDQDDG